MFSYCLRAGWMQLTAKAVVESVSAAVMQARLPTSGVDAADCKGSRRKCERCSRASTTARTYQNFPNFARVRLKVSCAEKCPMCDSWVVNYDRKTFESLATGPLVIQASSNRTTFIRASLLLSAANFI